MACRTPIEAWRSTKPNDNGKYPLLFNRRKGQQDDPYLIPCKRCMGCRIDLARDWSVRCVHEASLYKYNSFITVTYDDDNIDPNHNLVVADFQRFIKRLRDRVSPRRIRYFACGEYGDPKNNMPWIESNLGRPHFHAILFNYQFSDLKKVAQNKHGDWRYSSEKLTEIWTHGNTEVGDVNTRSAGYVARYTTKKIRGDMAADHYIRTDVRTGEMHQLKPETILCSKHPAIGIPWLEKFKESCRKGFHTIEGKKYPIPVAYMEKLQEIDEPLHQYLKEIRRQNAPDIMRDEEFQANRLQTKKAIDDRKLKKLAIRS